MFMKKIIPEAEGYENCARVVGVSPPVKSINMEEHYADMIDDFCIHVCRNVVSEK